MVNTHFQMWVLASSGVARYDIEVAQIRGFDLDWMVKKAMEKLERTDSEIAYERQQTPEPSQLNSTDYRTVLVKTLLYIQHAGLAKIDWARVENSVPDVSTIELDLCKDTRDASFLSIHNKMLTSSKRIRHIVPQQHEDTRLRDYGEIMIINPADYG